MSMKNLQIIFQKAKDSMILKYLKWVILLSVLLIGLVLADGARCFICIQHFLKLYEQKRKMICFLLSDK